MVQDIFPSEELKSHLQESKLDIITSIAMFYDLESPIEFVKNEKIIILSENLKIETINIEKIKEFLLLSKNILAKTKKGILR